MLAFPVATSKPIGMRPVNRTADTPPRHPRPSPLFRIGASCPGAPPSPQGSPHGATPPGLRFFCVTVALKA